jgi:hypothetical protein
MFKTSERQIILSFKYFSDRLFSGAVWYFKGLLTELRVFDYVMSKVFAIFEVSDYF